jgi:hypothetical protein
MTGRVGRVCAGIALGFGALSLTACHDLSRFSNSGDHYEGPVVAGDFLRAGFDPTASLCLVIDANHLQDAPGFLTSSDGRFASTPLRPIPQIWHDPLSTLTFGEGRAQNLVYVASPLVDADASGDVFVVVSLMQSGGVEARIVRGAPAADAGGGGNGGSPGTNLFGVFSLARAGGPCSF